VSTEIAVCRAKGQNLFCSFCPTIVALGRKKAAVATSLSPSTIDRLTQLGVFHPSRAFGRPLYSANDLWEFVQSNPLPKGAARPAPSRELCDGCQLRFGLSRAEAAQALDVSTRSFDRAVQRGLVHSKRVGRRLVFSLEELKRFMRDTTCEVVS